MSRTTVYWINGMDPRITCGVGDCTDAMEQCDQCAAAEGTIRRHERKEMRRGILDALGLRTRHESVMVSDD
jgi:hypothetical protein